MKLLINLSVLIFSSVGLCNEAPFLSSKIPRSLKSDVEIKTGGYVMLSLLGNPNSVSSSLDREWVNGYKRYMSEYFDSGLLFDVGKSSRPYHNLHGPHGNSPEAKQMPGGSEGLGKGLFAIGVLDDRVFFYDHHLNLIKEVSGYLKKDVGEAIKIALKEEQGNTELESPKIANTMTAIVSAILTAASINHNGFNMEALGTVAAMTAVVWTVATSVEKIMNWDLNRARYLKPLYNNFSFIKGEFEHIKSRRADMGMSGVVAKLKKHIKCSKGF